MYATSITSQKNSRGFTLVEMLMAMLVMTVGLLGLLQSVQLAYQQSLRDRVRNEAVLLAEAEMHDWRRDKFELITAPTPKTKVVQRVIVGAPRTFSVTRKVADMGGARPAKKLSVAVSWTIKGDTRSHEIHTMRIRRPDEN